MRQTIDETARRRSIQLKYNEDHHITPQQIKKDIKSILSLESEEGLPTTVTPKHKTTQAYIEPEDVALAADPVVKQMTRPELQKSIANTKKLMEEAARQLDFIQAAQYRDEIIRLEKQLELK